MKIKLLLLSLFLSAQSWAGQIGFDEGSVAQTGTVSWGGAGTALVGTDIIFNTILGTDTPLNSGTTLECRSCELDFATGIANNILPGITEFNGGGSFSVVGDAYDGLNLIASGVLVDGLFSLSPPTAFGSGDSRLFVSLGLDSKHDDLEAFFGYDPNQGWAFASTQLALSSCVEAVGFDCDVLNADLNNVARVPNPGALALFGSGLAAFGLMGFRRRA